MHKSLKLENNIACMYEGSAEKAILDILADADMLIFEREKLIEEDFIRRITGKEFARRYLTKEYGSKVSIIRVIDSKHEKFALPKAVRNKVVVEDVITNPEIEMLIIHNEGKFTEYKKSKLKPSEYCKVHLKMKNCKQYDFVKKYFANFLQLINAIKEYERCKQKESHLGLIDLIKDEYL